MNPKPDRRRQHGTSEGVGLRLAAFDWLWRHVEVHGDVQPWVLLDGFEFDRERVPVVSQRGILKLVAARLAETEVRRIGQRVGCGVDLYVMVTEEF